MATEQAIRMNHLEKLLWGVDKQFSSIRVG